MKTQGKKLRQAKSKEGKHTHTVQPTTNKTTVIINHSSLIPLNQLNSPIKNIKQTNIIYGKQDLSLCCIQGAHLNIKDRYYLKVKD